MPDFERIRRMTRGDRLFGPGDMSPNLFNLLARVGYVVELGEGEYALTAEALANVLDLEESGDGHIRRLGPEGIRELRQLLESLEQS